MVGGQACCGVGKGCCGGVLARWCGVEVWEYCKRFRIWVWLRRFDMWMVLVGGLFVVGKGWVELEWGKVLSLKGGFWDKLDTF